MNEHFPAVKTVYSAPNRAHHYGYARELHQAGMLQAFVCGFPRYSSRAPITEIGGALRRVDQLQTIYVASLKLKAPRAISAELAHWAKIQIDRSSRGALKNADVFLFYNGCGLESARWFRERGGVSIVEAVNSHVLVQERIMREEYKTLGLRWRPFHPRETKRRIAEVEEANYVLLPSGFVAKSFLSQGIPAERLLRVPYPLQKIPGASGVRQESKADDGVFRVLYVGTIYVRKGLRYLIEAFKRLKAPKKELWIVGPTSNPTGLEDVSVPEGVKFFGSLKGEELQAVYQRATVFCLPSIEEGLALVLSEALGYGLPVIATENTGVEDLLENGKGAVVVPIRDAEAIATHLNRLADDPDYLAAKRREAVEASNLLTERSKNQPTLSTTLKRVFNQRPAKVNALS